MRYFKDKNNEVYAYDKSQKPKKDLVKMSDAEVREHLRQSELTYVDKRVNEYPPMGEAADISHRQRQKQRMLVGQARERIKAGDHDAALLILIEAVEPIEDAKIYDGKVSAVKRKYPKSQDGE